MERADPERAVGQQAYMKSAMPYHGVVTADVRRIVRDVLRNRPLPSAQIWQEVVLRLWREASHREQRHAAIEVLVAKPHAPWLRPERLPMVEEMVVTGAWWDYVDALAINAVGPILRVAPADMKPALLGWAKGEDIWKRRSAILAQLKFKAATDEAFLAAVIAPSLGNREFFLAKAIGWALRQHSRTNPGVRRRLCRDAQGPARAAQQAGRAEGVAEGRRRGRDSVGRYAWRPRNRGTAMELDTDICDELLATTRAVRKRLDLTRPVPRDVVEDCLELAVQAPTGSNSQTWRWVVVDDADKRQALADLYRRGGEGYLTAAGETATGQTARVFSSALYLMEHLHEVPVHVIPCLEGRPGDGATVTQLGGYFASIYPAVWSFQLALRARGLGSCLTTLHLGFEKEAAEILGIPDNVVQTALLPVAYTLGQDFKRASRPPVADITHWNAWG